MTYEEPTVVKFKQRFPEFAIVNNEIVEDHLDEAISSVGSNWLVKDRARGQMLLAAHNLSLEGEPNRSQTLEAGGAVNSPAQGRITELKDRDAFVRFENSSEAAAAMSSANAGAAAKSYQETVYGKRYWKMMRKNTCSVVAV